LEILTVIGARPQFIKAATVSRVIGGRDGIREIIVHTGQHYDANMSDIFFEELSIPKPDFHLGIGNANHGAMTGRQLEAIETVIIERKPDLVLVYGDTNSTLAGALAAAKLHIPVAHIEAGLRSFNRKMPEEINRILTDHVSEKLMAPTDRAMTNLLNEGLEESRLYLVGDVMYDASLFYRSQARAPDWAAKIDLELDQFVLATVHRAENTDDPERLQGIFDGLARVELPVVLPLHPRTRARLAEYEIQPAAHLHLVNPVGYLEMVWLESRCRILITDSGGVQKEAYFFRKPCVTLRDETEWVELVELGWNQLVGSDSGAIAEAIKKARRPQTDQAIYGMGNAAELVVQALELT